MQIVLERGFIDKGIIRWLIPCFPSTARILANLPRGMLLLVITIMNIIKIWLPIKLRACALENGSDLHINKRLNILHYIALGLLKKSRGMYVNCAIIAMLYTHLIRIINNNNNRPPACTSTSLWDRKQGIKEWWPKPLTFNIGLLQLIFHTSVFT